MQIISRVICESQNIYKAIILDLDGTLWKGTLTEDGIEVIKRRLNSEDSGSFVAFMRFVKALSKELGIYVAICSRNDSKQVVSAIENLNEKEFPLKKQIDCIVANYNDKSKNIENIAKQLSILTKSCIFIDDNQLIRDEVKQNLPEVFVPNWESHNELITILTACCTFDRYELSLKSRNRKHQYKILQQEREKNHLPQLFIKVSDDKNHTEANRLYSKSNQFRFSNEKGNNECCKSLVFEIYRNNGENLGICSAITYTDNKQELHILNWAISCRYFEIGLEEYILKYIATTISTGQSITFTFVNTGFNGKAIALIEKYKDCFTSKNNGYDLCFTLDTQLMNTIEANTNLKELQ